MPHSPSTLIPRGQWVPDNHLPRTGNKAFCESLADLSLPVYIVDVDGHLGVAQDGTATIGSSVSVSGDSYPLIGWAPALGLESLGDPGFKADHGLKYAYVCGAMANGITSTAMVEAAGRAGMIGFFGAGGLSLEQIEAAIDTLQGFSGPLPFGFNLIHSPNDPDLEQKTVELYIAKNVTLISASAFLDLTPALVQYRIHGIHRDPNGGIVSPNRVVAKVSRVEVARQFFAPPPDKLLDRLQQQGAITAEEARLARRIPMASDLTAEADSGGHTDNRQALTLLPLMIDLRDAMAEVHDYPEPVVVGLGGGIATPASAAAAFAMGAGYVLTGTVNQACRESGSSDLVRRMLAEAHQADVTMAPAADMFEMGVRVQVLKRGTMFALRAQKLYDFYRRYESWEQIPVEDRTLLERDFFKCDFATEWQQTCQFFSVRDPKQIERAEQDPRHRLALVFRAYLGKRDQYINQGKIT